MKQLWNKHSYTIVLIGLSLMTALIYTGFSSNTSDQYITVTVEEGESVWEIAEQFANDHSLSPKQFVHWVQEKNGINGDIVHPGDQLLIPVKIHELEYTELASLPDTE